MKDRDPPMAHRNLPLLLLQARERVINRFRPLLNAQHITEQQWRIVRLLLESGPLEPRQIGEPGFQAQRDRGVLVDLLLLGMRQHGFKRFAVGMQIGQQGKFHVAFLPRRGSALGEG